MSQVYSFNKNLRFYKSLFPAVFDLPVDRYEFLGDRKIRN